MFFKNFISTFLFIFLTLSLTSLFSVNCLARANGGTVGDGTSYYSNSEGANKLIDDKYEGPAQETIPTEKFYWSNYPGLKKEFRDIIYFINKRTPRRSDYDLNLRENSSIAFITFQNILDNIEIFMVDTLTGEDVDENDGRPAAYFRVAKKNNKTVRIIELKKDEFNSKNTSNRLRVRTLLHEGMHHLLLTKKALLNYPDSHDLIRPFLKSLEVVYNEYTNQKKSYLANKTLPKIPKHIIESSKEFQNLLHITLSMANIPDYPYPASFSICPQGGGVKIISSNSLKDVDNFIALGSFLKIEVFENEGIMTPEFAKNIIIDSNVEVLFGNYDNKSSNKKFNSNLIIDSYRLKFLQFKKVVNCINNKFHKGIHSSVYCGGQNSKISNISNSLFSIAGSNIVDGLAWSVDVNFLSHSNAFNSRLDTVELSKKITIRDSKIVAKTLVSHTDGFYNRYRTVQFTNPHSSDITIFNLNLYVKNRQPVFIDIDSNRSTIQFDKNRNYTIDNPTNNWELLFNIDEHLTLETPSQFTNEYCTSKTGAGQ